MADGTIKIGVELDTSSLEAELAKLPEIASKGFSGAEKGISGNLKAIGKSGQSAGELISLCFQDASKVVGNLGSIASNGGKLFFNFGKDAKSAGGLAAGGADQAKAA